LYNTVLGKRIAILGFAYKKNTGDTRESAAIAIVNALVSERAEVMVYDPRVRDEQIWMELEVGKGEAEVREVKACVQICKDAYEACKGAHAVVIVTEWDEFRVVTNDSSKNELAPELTTLTNGTKTYDDMKIKYYPTNGKNTKDASEMDTAAAAAAPMADSTNLAPGPPTTTHLDWPHIATLMSKPMFVFDGRNIIDAAALESLGFRVECIGNARSGGRR
jgi:UDPglucose 6-dehydrogenase